MPHGMIAGPPVC